MYTDVSIYVYIYLHLCIYVFICMCRCLCMFISMYVYMYMYICILYIYIHMYIFHMYIFHMYIFHMYIFHMYIFHMYIYMFIYMHMATQFAFFSSIHKPRLFNLLSESPSTIFARDQLQNDIRSKKLQFFMCVFHCFALLTRQKCDCTILINHGQSPFSGDPQLITHGLLENPPFSSMISPQTFI